MARIYLILGLASLSAFSYAQYRGIGLFDGPTPTHARATGIAGGSSGGGYSGGYGGRSGGWHSGGIGSHPIFHK